MAAKRITTALQFNSWCKAWTEGTPIAYLGDGLELCSPSKAIFRYSFDKKRRRMGMGRFETLAELNAKHQAALAILRSGRDPLTVRDEEARERRAKETTFRVIADSVLATKMPTWKSKRHTDQWTQSLDLAAKSFGKTPVENISTDDVLRLVKPVWAATPETGRRLLHRVEAVLDTAKALGLRSGENPARWRGHMAVLLPKLPRGEHFASMPFLDLPAFIRRLREDPNGTARVLEFLILTACRTGEVLGARWSEVDMEARTWTIPKERMKAGEEHVVPLSGRAVEILVEMREACNLRGRRPETDFVFQGLYAGSPYSHIVLQKCLERLGVKGATPHGFRSTFRNWAGAETNYPREVCEHALAHRLGDSAERAYWRDQGLKKRSLLMRDWAAYCGTAPGGNAGDDAYENDAFADVPGVAAMTPAGFDEEMARFVDDAVATLKKA